MKKRNLRLEKKMYNYLVSTDPKDRSILFQIIEGKACFRDIKDLIENIPILSTSLNNFICSPTV